MKNNKFLLFILFIIAILPPLISVIIENPMPQYGSDDFDYNQMAVGLLAGRGFHSISALPGILTLPNARHPLYPLYIAIIYFFTNNSLITVKMTQIIIHGLTCVIIFFISRKLLENKLLNFGTGMLWAFYPLAISTSVVLLSETFFTFLLAASVLFLLKNRESPSLKMSLFSGLFLGLTALTKSIVFTFIPFLFLWLILFSKKKLMLRLKNFSLIIFFMALIISPWLIRNYIVLKHFFPIATIGGLSFYRCNNEKVLETVHAPVYKAFPFTEEQKEKISTLSERELDKYLYSLGWQFIKSHPRDFLKIKLITLGYFWHLWPASPKRFTEFYMQYQEIGIRKTFLERWLDPFLNCFKRSYLLYLIKILYHIPYNILFLGMFVNFASSFKRDREQWKKSLLLFLLIATINAVYLLYRGSDRYRMPIDPYVFILGLQGVVSFYDNIKRRRR